MPGKCRIVSPPDKRAAGGKRLSHHHRDHASRIHVGHPFGASKAEVVAEQTDGTKTWRYDSNSAGGILYAGDYIRQDIQAGGMDIEFYYGRKHQAVMEAAGAAEAVKSVVDYCTAHYGMLSFGSGDT